MDIWEYYELFITRTVGSSHVKIRDSHGREITGGTVIELLNRLGLEGWDLADVRPVGMEDHVYFKRKVNTAQRMEIWEYYELFITRIAESNHVKIRDSHGREMAGGTVIELLNRLGREGWELADMRSVGMEDHTYFKRRAHKL